ncbi:MAG: carboxypeptidase-like regulatory domain-containing protein [Chloroflexota bacterium]
MDKTKRSLSLSRHYPFFLFILILATLSLQACTPTRSAPILPQNDTVATMVEATFQALTMLAPSTPTLTLTPTLPTNTPSPDVPTATPTSELGKVQGKVCFLRASIPEMTAFFQNTHTNAVSTLNIAPGQGSYEVELLPGNYIAYAWLTDFSIGGMYSACPMGSGCNAHNPLMFIVTSGQTLTGIDLCDWHHGPFDVPYPPEYSPDVTVGSISGNIYGYPGPAEAQLIVVAFNQTTKYWYWFRPAPGVRYFFIEDLPPGTYQVVAYDTAGKAGGTSPDIVVAVGKNTIADINNWSGTFPANPVK